jgi:hypothetical protein
MSVEIQDIFGVVVAAISVAVAAYGLAGVLRTGVLKRIRFGSFEIEGSSEDASRIRTLVEQSHAKEPKDIPFEIEQLANYYSQILAQSKVSFWFSLIFASLGFAVIVVAAFLYKDTNTGATFAQFIAGIVMDTVAGLFFVQSRNAQKSMGEFFDKLRKDRAQVESRNLCEAIQSEQAKDALRVHLALYYAGVEQHENLAKNITEATLGNPYNKPLNSDAPQAARVSGSLYRSGEYPLSLTEEKVDEK